MRLFISSDIEGTCGITDWNETKKSQPDYEYFSKQMSLEVAAVCQAALDSGNFEDIYIRDAHDTARNIQPDLLPVSSQIHLIRGWSGSLCPMMTGIDNADVVAYTGYHSGVGSGDSPLSHTNNLNNSSIVVNGMIFSEFIQNSYYASSKKKPVLFISGDQGICNVAKDMVPSIYTVPVGQGIGGATISIHPRTARNLIYSEALKAFEGNIDCNLIDLPSHFHVEYEFVDLMKAVKAGLYPGASQIESKKVQYDASDYEDVLKFIMFVG